MAGDTRQQTKRNGLFPVVLSMVVAGAFVAGLFEPEVRAHGGLPELFSSLRPGAAGRELDPINTHNKALTIIRDKFYGDTPTDRKLTYTAVKGMLNALDDPYTRFLEPQDYTDLRQENTGEFEGIGAQLEGVPTKEGYIRISRPIPNGPAAKAGVKRGDMISKIDGATVVGLTVDQAVKKIRGKADTTVKLTLVRPGSKDPVEVAITRKPVEFEVVESRMEEGKIGYISLAQFNELADPKIEQAIRKLESQGMRGLVLDLRGNPGGLLDAAIDISSRFVNPGKNVVVIVESGGEKDARKTNAQKFLGGKWPLVVLVNRTSASASEIVAGAVKDNQAGTIVGATTFGKGLVQTVVPLEDGSACMITTAKYLTPLEKDINRSREQRGGVEPDVMVEITEEQFLKGKDVQLQKGLELLHEKVGYKPAPKPGAAAANTN